MTNAFNALHLAQEQIADLDLQLLKRKLKATESPCDTKALVNGRELKAFCSNDYLGLANHPDLVQALAEGAAQYGIGSGASHLIRGTALPMRFLKVSWQIFKSNKSQMHVHSFLVPATLLT